MLVLEEFGQPACIPPCFNTNVPDPYAQPSYFNAGIQSWQPVYQQIRQISQFDRPFSSPLPMPSPTSCWYPQRDVQFGHSYPDPTRPIPASPFSVPRPSSVFYPRPEPDPPDWPLLYTAAQPPFQPFQPPSPPYQPPYNGVDHPEPLGVPCDSVMPNTELNLPVAALVSQLERLTAIVRKLESRMDANERCLGDPQAATSHCRTTAPLPAATAAPSLNLPPPTPPCSPDISGDEGELLDDDPIPLVVISQSGDPDTSPTSVPHVVLVVFPSSMKMEISKG